MARYIKSCREAVSKHPDVTLDMVDWCAYASEVGMKLIKHEFMLAFKIMSKCNHSVDGKPGLLDKYSGCIKEMVYIISGCIKEMDDIISEIKNKNSAHSGRCGANSRENQSGRAERSRHRACRKLRRAARSGRSAFFRRQMNFRHSSVSGTRGTAATP